MVIYFDFYTGTFWYLVLQIQDKFNLSIIYHFQIQIIKFSYGLFHVITISETPIEIFLLSINNGILTYIYVCMHIVININLL